MTRTFADLEEKVSTLEGEWVEEHVLPASMRLYHFTSPEGLAGILNDRGLRASLATAMGDSQELKHLIEPDDGADKPRPLTQYQTLGDALFAKFLPDPHTNPVEAWRAAGGPFVASFCIGSSAHSIDRLYHWRTFGREGRGYVLGCDRPGQGDEGTCGQWSLRKVLYGTEGPKGWVNKITGLRDDVKNRLTQTTRSVRNGPGEELGEKEPKGEILALEDTARKLWLRLYKITLELTACVKAKEFAIEAEWRLVLTAGDQVVRVRSSEGGIAPYVAYPIHIPEKGHAEQKSSTGGPCLTLREIIIGPAANARITEPSLKFLLGDAKIERGVVEIFSSNLSIR